ncbi:beta-conglycinin, beta chain-like [Vigna radiata var. radiata]|uniref:Beta-conglycinin, beta chain-like n=1 Tax=Vigna radiata var. radiata TaxID=3916 RepID=A0A1S3VZW2_VIGRR|nr:beta-conglycinin, beta chain-like [Vigna radiata var. radiata]
MRSRFPLFLVLGIVFLASVSVSLTEKPSRSKCVQTCESEKDAARVEKCQLRCKHVSERGEKEEEEEKVIPEPHPSHEEKEEHEREEEQWKGRQRREDPEERERVRQRERKKEEEMREREKEEEMREREKEGEREKEEEMREREKEEEMREREKEEEMRERERKKGEKYRRREKKEKWEEVEEDRGYSDSQTQNNPFHFSSNRFHTLFKNQHGHMRVLQSFDQRSSIQLQNLRDYRVVEFKSRPHTLLLPHHANADFLLVVLSGRALINLVEPDNRDPYYLDPGYAQIIPAGTTFYLVNPERNKNLRVIKLAIPVNKPGKFENFFLSSTQEQQSYLQGFSEDILEASFDSKFEDISKVLFGEEILRQRQQEGVIVELSNEKIRELSRSAESSSRKINSFKYKPFDLRSSHPIYSNKLGAFYETTPEKNPHLQELNIFLNYVDIKKGGLLLPHYNSKAIVILVVNEGETNIELVAVTEQQQQQKRQEVQRYTAELSKDDVFVIPAAYPVAINATSNLNFFAFGINAENNQRNFLAGEKDNVISEIPRQVFEVAFPGSGEDVEKLIKKKRESYFVAAQPQQKEDNHIPLSSILGALH